MIFNLGFGKPGNGLTFEVIASAAQPSEVREKTIWVCADVAMTDWVFSPIAPEGVAGRVWIQTGSSSPAGFNAMEQNGILIYPTSCWQFVAGAWIPRTAKSFLNGTWVDWYTYLYNHGEENTALTGGWTTIGRAIGQNNYYTAPSLTKNADSMIVETTDGSGSGMAYAAQPIDLTGYKTLTFKGMGETNDDQENATMLGVWSTLEGYYNSEALAAWVTLIGVTSEISVDVSALNGKFYIGFGIHKNASTVTKVTVEEVYLS